MADFTTIKLAVENSTQPLDEILSKIDMLNILGRISNEEVEFLYDLARNTANSDDSLPPAAERIATLEKKVAELEGLIKYYHEVVGDEPEPDEWPEYVAPTGAHDAYNTGDKITWDGKRYTCTMDGCVWNPTDYPAGWQLAD